MSVVRKVHGQGSGHASTDDGSFNIETETISSSNGGLSLTNKTIGEYREYASKLGSDFSQMDYHYYVLQMLYLVEYADYDSQSKLGQGITNPGDEVTINMGGTDSLGMQSGCLANDGKTSIIYRG